jgi:glycerol-3-phosphate cytidylyltransferase
MYRIGYTTGVFDLFHIGHLNIIRKAKAQCEILIVGVSTDELVQAYKHKLPVIPFDERVQIVESIRYVDKVVKQTTLDKIEAWERLHYNALFHGDDWKGTDLYTKTEERLKAVGVEVIYIPHTQGISSTEILQRI